jgi:hypothetical protein
MTAVPDDHIAIHPETHNASDLSLGYLDRLFRSVWLEAHDYVEIMTRHTTNLITGLGIGVDYIDDGVSASVPSVQIVVKSTTMGAWTEAGLELDDDLEVNGDITIIGSGDIIPSGAGDGDEFIGNAANYFNRVHTHRVNLKELGEPGTPITGTAWLYLDSADGDLKIKFDTGNKATIQAVV